MARYVERADNVARFIDVNLNLSLDLGPTRPAMGSVGRHNRRSRGFQAAMAKLAGEVLQFLTFDEENPNSILSCLRSARKTPARSAT